MKLKKVENIHQQGPTCGIYAVAMILVALNSTSSEDPQVLASNIFDIAISREISIIGEIFTIEKMIQLLNEVKVTLWDDEKRTLNFSITEFTSSEDMKTKIVGSLEKENYILFPFNLKNIDSNNNDNVLMHWGVIYDLEDDDKVSLVEGNNNKKYNNINIFNLYSSNQSLIKDYKWRNYFNFFRKCFLTIDDFIYTYNKDIKDKIKSIKKAKSKKLKKESSFLDAKGKMVIIGATEIT